MKAVVKKTGEVIEFEPKNLTEAMDAWQTCKQYIDAYTKVRDQLKPFVESFVNDKGVSDEADGYIFRVSNIQRMNYDKAVLRQYLDEDAFDLMLEPNKKAVDDYLKANLDSLGETSTAIREAMVPVGKPYQVIKAERIA